MLSGYYGRLYHIALLNAMPIVMLHCVDQLKSTRITESPLRNLGK